MTKEEYLIENEKRKIVPEYDPVSGLNAYGERKEVFIEEFGTLYLPISFLKLDWVVNLIELGSIAEYCKEYAKDKLKPSQVTKQFIKERYKHDCEYWLSTQAKIKLKGGQEDAYLIPTNTQRKVLYAILDDWFAKKPVRFIVVKCRQAFITTIVSSFFMWVQLIVFRQWNSLICGDVENQALNVRGIQDKIASGIPNVMTDDGKPYELLPFEGSQKTRTIEQRDCRFSTGSMQKPENVRCADNMGSHCTEVGLWKTTEGKTPEDLIQAIRGGMDDVEYTVFGLESTAKGTGNYFYEQWIEAINGRSDLKPIFLSWFLVNRYSKEIENYDLFFDEFLLHPKVDYLLYLWNEGVTLEQLNWYMSKLKTGEHWRVQSEFPSNSVEAFQTTGRRAFPPNHVETIRKMCTIEPKFVGEIEADERHGKEALKNIRLVQVNAGLKVWAHPDREEIIRNRYVVVVDVGKGATDKADFSVITVFDRYAMMFGGNPEVVAEWHDKTPIDLLAWKSAQIATYYCNALLVIESNTIETQVNYFEYILSEIADHYDNLYSRTPEDKIREGAPRVWGFHTNNSTKPMIIGHLQRCLRDVLYYERNLDACTEFDTYELKADGKFGAADKCHDDLVMTRAIGLFVCYQMDLPYIVKENEIIPKKIIGLSSM